MFTAKDVDLIRLLFSCNIRISTSLCHNSFILKLEGILPKYVYILYYILTILATTEMFDFILFSVII